MTSLFKAEIYDILFMWSIESADSNEFADTINFEDARGYRGQCAVGEIGRLFDENDYKVVWLSFMVFFLVKLKAKT